MTKRILIVASSGGHLTQALAGSSLINHRIVVTNKSGVVKLRCNDVEFNSRDTTKNIFIHFLNFFLAINIFLKFNVAGIFSTGGPMCLPFLLVAKMLGKKIYYLDTMSRIDDLSNTGKLVYKLKLYDEFVVQWDELQSKYKGVSYYGQIFNIYDGGNSQS